MEETGFDHQRAREYFVPYSSCENFSFNGCKVYSDEKCTEPYDGDNTLNYRVSTDLFNILAPYLDKCAWDNLLVYGAYTTIECYDYELLIKSYGSSDACQSNYRPLSTSAFTFGKCEKRPFT